jgi:hypothetical protein
MLSDVRMFGETYFWLSDSPEFRAEMQVGATAAVGLVEGSKGVSWKVLGTSVIGWIFTIIIVGLLSAILMALGIYTPNINMAKSIATFEEGINAQGKAFVERFADCANPGLQVNPAPKALSDLKIRYLMGF